MALAAIAALGACDSEDFINVVAGTQLVISAPTNGQTAPVGTALPLPLSVRVLDPAGNPVAGATVSWAVIGNGGAVSAATSESDVYGDASVVWTMPALTGVYSVQASLRSGATADFTATATAGPVAQLVLLSGQDQFIPAGTTTAPLAIQAFDALGNPAAGIQITYATTAGTLSATFVLTDADGKASVTLTTAAGPYTVTASSGNASPIVFAGNGT